MKTELWCCRYPRHRGGGYYYDWTSLSYLKRDSIKKCTEGSIHPWNGLWKDNGWECVEVLVTINPINR